MQSHFNPRSPHGERPKGGEGRGKACKFQSTLPARGATASCPSHPAPPAHFNPRSPHGERRGISYPSFYRKLFQSTLPARGATARRWTACGLYGISIHAPRTGSDLCAVDQPHAGDGISIHAPRTGSDWTRRRLPSKGEDFNPRSPHGERHEEEAADMMAREFQSTLPARGATRWCAAAAPRTSISIHAPRTGSDLVSPARP